MEQNRIEKPHFLLGSLMSLTMPLGLLFAGPVAEYYGVSTWFSVDGISILIITFVGMLLFRRIR